MSTVAAGFEHHRAGRLAQAKELYSAVLEVDPDNVDALHLLGVLAFQEGRHEDACRLLDRAVHLNPCHAEALSNYGVVLTTLQRPGEALAYYEKVLALNPEHVETLLNRGIALYRLNRYQEALLSYERAVRISPRHPDALSNLGSAQQQLGRHEEALRSYNAALAIRPEHVDALMGRGSLLQLRARHAEALADFDRALAIHPNNAQALSNQGNSLQGMGRYEEALASYERALAIAPDFADVLSNSGTALHQLRRYDEALASYDSALGVRRDYPEAWVNRGAALHELGRYDEALASYDEALKISPRSVEALSNRGRTLRAIGGHVEALGCFEKALAIDPSRVDILCKRGGALQALGRPEEAIIDYEKSLAINPRYAEAHLYEGFCRLLNGDFERGWKSYEWRWELDGGAQKRRFDPPRWSGKENVKGKTVLLHAEQGFGDTVQFCRYVDMVCRRGAKVVLEVQPPLKSLVSTLSGAHAVIARGDPLPEFDWHCPLLSLPLAFDTELGTIPASVPYLRAPAAAVHKWRDKLPSEGFTIGIAWSGSSVDPSRSIAFEQLSELASPRATLVSLQRELRREDRATLEANRRTLHFGAEFQDFADTAAVVSLVDLVICIDTAAAHVAGALGKPVWILLPYVADWRWLRGRSDSPWYPTARLFRQPAPGDWTSVMSRVQDDLARRLSLQNERPMRR